MLRKVGVIFRCTSTLYPVWDAFGARGFCGYLVGGYLDVRTSVGSCTGVSLDRVCTWYGAL